MQLKVTRITWVLALALTCFAFATRIAAATQNHQGTPNQSESLIYSLKGPDLFRAYCSACHGSTGKGDGPAASALKAKVPDLTLLAKMNGGQFPLAWVRKIIAGDEVFPSHGSREMPIWGPIFHQVEEDRDYGNVRLENLVKYLESIQVLASSTPESGAELYNKYCAACHGMDLKEGGSAPSPYRLPPDLTTLTRRHGGTFPEAYVSDVLRNGVVMPAHGPAEMPVWGNSFRVGDRLTERQVTARISKLTKYIKSHQIQ
jgi:mono/diheme cytochrome c family protein